MSPPSSPGSRSLPALWSTELPFALLPPKKRWLWLWRTTSEEATDPVSAAPLPPPVLPQIHATPAAAGAAATTTPLGTPAPAAREADALVSSPAAGQKRSLSPLPALTGDLYEPNAPLPPAADGKPSTPPPCKRGRKVVRRVRKIVEKIVPKGTTSSAAARKKTIAAAETAGPATGAAGASLLQAVPVADEEYEPGEFVPDKTAADCKNAVVPRQPLLGEKEKEEMAVADEEQEPGEFIPDKTAADCNNADAARQPLLGEHETAGEEAAVDVAGEPEAAEEKLVGNKQGYEERAETARQNRMREVFVGALHTDAKEEDVRAALAESGVITDVRIIMDAGTAKNKGYCFVRYREPAQARKAIEELGSVKICGKPCRIQALEVNGKSKLAQRDDPFEDYSTQIHYEDTRPFPMGGNSYYMSHNPHARNGSNAYAMEISSYGAVPHTIGGYSPVYHHGSIMYLPDSNYYGLAQPWDGIPMRQSGSRRPGQPHGCRH